jgi:hypothetical protein
MVVNVPEFTGIKQCSVKITAAFEDVSQPFCRKRF